MLLYNWTWSQNPCLDNCSESQIIRNLENEVYFLKVGFLAAKMIRHMKKKIYNSSLVLHLKALSSVHCDHDVQLLVKDGFESG